MYSNQVWMSSKINCFDTKNYHSGKIKCLIIIIIIELVVWYMYECYYNGDGKMNSSIRK